MIFLLPFSISRWERRRLLARAAARVAVSVVPKCALRQSAAGP